MSKCGSAINFNVGIHCKSYYSKSWLHVSKFKGKGINSQNSMLVYDTDRVGELGSALVSRMFCRNNNVLHSHKEIKSDTIFGITNQNAIVKPNP